MKIGVIGIGSIARKAYLPTYVGLENAELFFCTRNPNTLEELKSRYHFTHLNRDIDQWLDGGIEAAFVHAATKVHPQIIEKLLNHHIAVYTDKPIADSYAEAKRLVALAAERDTPLMTGFNRRFAPFYQEAAKITDKSKVILQKNRINAPVDLRTFVYDDFIHLIDTLRFQLKGKVELSGVQATKNNQGLYTDLTVLLRSGEKTAIALMNRVSGANEEILQVMSPLGECAVTDLVHMDRIEGTKRQVSTFGDWETTLHKRGFEQIVQAFIHAIDAGEALPISEEDALASHFICEQIIEQLA
ncbi:MAG: Gfo/Idh/MocA family protein [Sporolactobacillus sp.]